MNATVAAAGLAGGVLWLAGCLAPRTPWVVTLPAPGVTPAAHIDYIATERQAAVTVAAILEKDFGVRPFPIALHFYPNRASFEAALVEEGQEPALAAEMANGLSAIGGPRRVAINESHLGALSWPERVHMLAHEIVHTLQYEWGGGVRGASDQWLREGYAEWVALRVLDRLHADIGQHARRAYLAELHAAGRRGAPRLDQMATFRDWLTLRHQRDAALYAQAFLAVDFLIARRGQPAVVRYFELFARSQDRLAHFRAAFGEDLSEFETAAAEHLWGR